MVSIFLSGILLGLSAGLAPGPMLTLVVTQTLRYGGAEGLKVSLAPLATDLPIVLASLIILGRLTDFEAVLGGITLAGSLFVFYLAYETYQTDASDLDFTQDRPRSLRRGIIINFLNPHPYLFWITVGAPIVIRAGEVSAIAPALFVAAFYVLLVGSKMGLALVVGKSRAFLTSRNYVYAMRGLGILLALFALLLLRDALRLLSVLQ
jgi:threonine/homoserine/homoserine lactone efflux protein